MSKQTVRWVAAAAASVVVLAGVGCARQEVKSADMSSRPSADMAMSGTTPSANTSGMSGGSSGMSPSTTTAGTTGMPSSNMPSSTSSMTNGSSGMGQSAQSSTMPATQSGISMSTTNPNRTADMTTGTTELPARADRN